jgi:hypothetical protein
VRGTLINADVDQLGILDYWARAGLEFQIGFSAHDGRVFGINKIRANGGRCHFMYACTRRKSVSPVGNASASAKAII